MSGSSASCLARTTTTATAATRVTDGTNSLLVRVGGRTSFPSHHSGRDAGGVAPAPGYFWWRPEHADTLTEEGDVSVKE